MDILYPAVVAWFARASVFHSVNSDLRRAADQILLEDVVYMVKALDKNPL